MTTLLEIKEKMKIFYGKYDIYIIPILKFSLAILAFLLINANIGFMSKIKSPAIALILALMCSFLPVNMIAVFGLVLILAHAYALSVEVLGIAFVLIAVMLLLYFRMTPEYGYLLILTPLAFILKIPYAVPIVMGLIGTPITAIPVACGTIIYYLVHYMKLNTTMLSESAEDTMKQKVMYLVENVINNKEMILVVLAFSLTLIIVYVIRRMSVDYSWMIAIGTGAISNVLVLLLGDLVLNISIKVIPLLIGTAASIAIVFILQFFIFSVDYSRSEYVQFEDDEYYYYVKAIPKISIAVSDKKVKQINVQKKAVDRKKR